MTMARLESRRAMPLLAYTSSDIFRISLLVNREAAVSTSDTNELLVGAQHRIEIQQDLDRSLDLRQRLHAVAVGDLAKIGGLCELIGRNVHHVGHRVDHDPHQDRAATAYRHVDDDDAGPLGMVIVHDTELEP